jgi:tRNA(fMet)-specific endonuclease VapC
MGVLIDTSVLIKYERGRIDLSKKFAGREAEDFFLSVVTASELLHGVHRAKDASIRARRSAFVETILASFPILTIDLATARIHSEIGASLSAAGTLIGPHDLWLAASCITHGLNLATENLREFERVPGLSIESWTA